MLKCLVTGVAGFVGSHLAEELVKHGHYVIGIDCFNDFYPRYIKEQNLENILSVEGFDFIEADLLDINLELLLDEVDYIFHQAGQVSVRASWGMSFDSYVRNNIFVTQRMLESAKNTRIKKFIYASSSSIYGDAESFPTSEDTLPQPVSPYGVTKLAAEHLCMLYYKNFQVPTIALRYFTVYGPRQRPDMAFNKFIKSIIQEDEITIYGDGEQTRDFTFINDIVKANLLAMETDAVGEVLNIGGGSRITVNNVLKILREIMDNNIKVKYIKDQKGDAKHTSADITKARRILQYEPGVLLRDGLKAQIEWMMKMPNEVHSRD